MLNRFMLFGLIIAISSCIREESLNPEADILSFSLPNGVAIGESIFNEGDIAVRVRKDADLSGLVPAIEITPGATIEPTIHTPQDFSHPVTYTVTAADGLHQRKYVVTTSSSALYHFSFEQWELLSSGFFYLTPVEYEDGERRTIWDSSNKGVSLYQKDINAEALRYPVHPTEKCKAGKYAAEMVTGIGPGKIFTFKIPITAGSLFTGVMSLATAMTNPLASTRFGQPCMEKPLRFRGYYNYHPGEGDYITAAGVLSGKRDTCTIQAVFFRVDENLPGGVLDGTNNTTHPNILAIAQLPDSARTGTKGDGYLFFDLPFVYRSDEELDFEHKEYKIAIILSSSAKGDLYEGVAGSRLRVDELEIVTTE
ncbi:MAG: PCMD domain-containing protein [Tannerellaceae bacterium]|jgi:hypothetical protein|nr:PCMD domain-containing protein [Tannerellaceae bacterium]